MNASISHDRQDESPEAKARWFRSLSLTERMELLCSYTNLILSVRPDLMGSRDARPIAGRIQVLRGT